MKVRSARKIDYEQVEALWQELNQHHAALEPGLIQPIVPYQTREQYLEILASEQEEIAVCENEGKLIGAIWLVQRKHEGGSAIPMPVAFIQEICVSSVHRGSGVGRALMDFAEQWAQSRRLDSIEFNVWAGNRRALAFYENLGFRYVRHEMTKPVAGSG